VKEVILVNDHSSDSSTEIAASFARNNWKLLSLPNEKSGKKAALEFGILEAKTDYIWTLDSDVEILDFKSNRFEEFQIELNEDLVIFPVKMNAGASVLKIFQANEWRYMQFLTWLSARVGMPMMCNGANLIFKRSVFLEHLDSHRSISGGDDLFLLARVMKSKGEIGMCWKGFCEVTIAPLETWRNAVVQRVRWAGKTTKLPLTKATFLHLLFALFSALHVLAFIGAFFPSIQKISLLFLAVKIAVEVACLSEVFSRRLKGMEWLVLLPQMVLYPFFSLSIFISSLFFIPKWKGRRVSLK
jgi:glycosyltransferase involved in cell wall biosynthesis